MRNLEDPTILQDVKKVSRALGALGVNVPRQLEAAAQAYLEAVRHPNSDVRITCGKSEGVAVFDALTNIDRYTRSTGRRAASSTSWGPTIGDTC